MTDRAPIPTEVFDDAIDRLDRDALAAFVGRLEAAAGGSIEVDPPIVTVDDGDHRERVLVAPGASDSDAAPRDGTGPDAVVVPDGSSDMDYDVPVRTTEDLRHRLLYAASPEAAASIAEEWLGTPVRSTSYAPEPTPPAATGVGSDADSDAEPGTNPGRPDEQAAGIPDGQRGSPPSESGTGDGDGAGTGGTDGKTPRTRPSSPDRGDGQSDTAATWSGAGIVVVGALVVMILAVAGGVVYAAEVSPDADAGAFAAPAPASTGGLTEAELRRSRGPIDESGAVITSTPTPVAGNGSDDRPLPADTEADRNVRPAPNCNRSFLSVVQIQMNALKYNNNTTNDGIRTVRRFASPRNRQTIQTFEEFVRIIKTPTYSPMLSHNSAQYTPIQSSDDYAQVQVITREDANVTGQYYFRLRKIDGGTYDGCWMTDAVVSVPETTSFSGKVGTQSIGSNGTS